MSQPIVMLLPLLAYLLAAIPFGLVLTRWLTGIDVRKTGSGNIGATNVRRVAGMALGLATLGCDLLKGALPTAAALYLTAVASPPLPPWYAAGVALITILGHMFPVYLAFKPSGKGVATALGCFLVLTPWASLIALLTFACIVAASRRVSAGSLAACIILPLTVWWTTQDLVLIVTSLVAIVLIISRHGDNIRRLRRGQEPTWKNRS